MLLPTVSSLKKADIPELKGQLRETVPRDVTLGLFMSAQHHLAEPGSGDLPSPFPFRL